MIAVSAKTGRGIDRLLDRIEAQFAKHTARIPTGELNRFLGELREARQPPAGGQAAEPALRHADGTRPPRFRFFVNDPSLVTRDYGYWVENELRERFELEGVPVSIDFVSVRVISRRRRGHLGTAFSRLLLDRGHEVTLVCRDADAGGAIGNGAQPALPPDPDLCGVVPASLADAPLEDASSSSSRCLAGVRRGRALAAGQCARALADERPRPGDRARLSTLVRAGRSRCCPDRTWPKSRRRPAGRGGGRERGRGARRASPAGDRLGAFRIYVNPDIVGVELCAAAKNVIALAAGGVDGLGLGDNAKAALVTRGLAEMARLGEAFGGRPETFAGLAGMGDLIVTCCATGATAPRGELIARGTRRSEAAAEIGQGVEGLTTAPVLRDLSRRLGIELPITEGVCAVLDGMRLADSSRA